MEVEEEPPEPDLEEDDSRICSCCGREFILNHQRVVWFEEDYCEACYLSELEDMCIDELVTSLDDKDVFSKSLLYDSLKFSFKDSYSVNESPNSAVSYKR